MSAQERVLIFLPYGDGDDERGAQFVSVNGNDFMVPKNVFVEVPVSVYEVLREARTKHGFPRFPGLEYHGVSISFRCEVMTWKFNRELDRIHDELLAKLRTMARATGQHTRVDRVRQ